MKTQDAIQFAGSTGALAEMLGVTPSAISQWGDFPPDVRQLQIEKASRRRLKAEPGCLDRVLNPPSKSKEAA